MAPKRVKAEDNEGASPKPKAIKKPKVDKSAHVDEHGFHVYNPATLLYKDWDTKPNKKIAAFDMDGTLILVKSGNQFARDADDWKFFNKNVPAVLRDLHEKGHKIVIFSNQGAVKSAVTGKAASNVKTKLNNIVKQVGVPAVAIMSTMTDEFRKPKTGMWDFLVEKLNGGVQPDKSKCFFVGDMAGRDLDPNQSATDKEFAEANGIAFKIPEDMFGEMEGKKVLAKHKSDPASGDAASTPAGDGPNAELAGIFLELSKFYFNRGEGSDRFKGSSNRKVGDALAAYPKKIDESLYKEVNSIAGIGKGSMATIKEYVETGKVEAYEEFKAGGGSPAAVKEAGPAKPPSKAAENALKFM